jgi:FkbM family methyltransferase
MRDIASNTRPFSLRPGETPWRGILGKTHKALSRSRFGVAVALRIRNQSEMVLQWYLGEGDKRELNGEQRLIELIAPASRNFIDVGANVGEWSELFLRAGGAEKRGILIEPSRSASAILERTFAGDARLGIIRAAVSDTEGEAVFHEEGQAGETSSLLSSFSSAGAEAVCVRVTTVDREVADAGWDFVDVLKIDAEGYDLHVIRGAQRLISDRAVGILQFEYNAPWAPAGSTLASAFAFLEGYEYRIFLVRSTGLHPFNYARWGEFYRCTNFVAVSPQRLSLVGPLVREEV